jgi:hypothetical protein
MLDNASAIKLNRAGFVEVQVADQTSPLVDLYMHQELASVTIATTVTADGINRDLTLEPGHGTIVGEYLGIVEGAKFQQSKVLVVNVNVITLDTPFVNAFTPGARTTRLNINMNTNGSVTPVVFNLMPPTGLAFDIVRIMIFISATGAMDGGTFGSRTALPIGCVLRKEDTAGAFNIFNFKTNGELELRNFDGRYSSKAVPNVFTFTSRRTFGGQDKNGVVIRIDGDLGESIENLVQDDLTSQTEFFMVAQGHVVQKS